MLLLLRGNPMVFVLDSSVSEPEPTSFLSLLSPPIQNISSLFSRSLFNTSCPASRSKKPTRHWIRAQCQTLTLHGLTTKVSVCLCHGHLTTRQMMVSMANLWIWLAYSFFLSRCLVYNYLCHYSSQDFVFYYPIYQSRSKLDTDKLDIQYCKYKGSLCVYVQVDVCGCVHGYIKLGEDNEEGVAQRNKRVA